MSDDAKQSDITREELAAWQQAGEEQAKARYGQVREHLERLTTHLASMRDELQIERLLAEQKEMNEAHDIVQGPPRPHMRERRCHVLGYPGPCLIGFYVFPRAFQTGVQWSHVEIGKPRRNLCKGGGVTARTPSPLFFRTAQEAATWDLVRPGARTPPRGPWPPDRHRLCS